MNHAAIQEAKSRIVEVIGERLELKQRGRIYFALCPFHPDRHPSLNVNPQKSAWFCNVCNLGGDVFSFLMKFHSVDFKEALKLLGVESSGAERHQIRKGLSIWDVIKKDLNRYLSENTEEHDALCTEYKGLAFLIASTPPLERDAKWFAKRHWIEEKFEELDEEREKLFEIAAEKRKALWQKVEGGHGAG